MHTSRLLELPQKVGLNVFGWDYFPSTAMTVSKTMTTRRPADETAAAVSSPDMAEAMLRPARTNMMMKSTMIPRGVLIVFIIVPDALRGMVTHTSSKDIGRIEHKTRHQRSLMDPGSQPNPPQNSNYLV